MSSDKFTTMEGSWYKDKNAFAVYCRTEKGEMKICDIRGWGFLTGTGSGALGLSNEEAVKIQKAHGRAIVALPDLIRMALTVPQPGAHPDEWKHWHILRKDTLSKLWGTWEKD